jgi:TonB family protein
MAGVSLKRIRKMVKPLVSANPLPEDRRFTHFGVLDAGSQSKTSVFTAVTINVVVAVIAVIISAAAVKAKMDSDKLKEVTFVTVKPLPKPPAPRIVPPKPVPLPPEVKPVEPKIVLPKITPPVEPKPMPVAQPKPLPAVTPAPPKIVVAAAAPKPMPVNLGHSASVVNHDAHPTAVALGSPSNPIAPSNRPATSAVNLGQRGLAGMPASNMGGGPPSTRVNLGSGQPGGSMSGSGSRAIAGVKLGVTNGTPGGTGNGVGTRPAQISLGQAPPPPPSRSVNLEHPPARSGPQVIYKPKPAYTAEATAAKIEGVVSVRIHVSANGSVTVIGVTNGLGYGLDQSAVRAVQGTRFRPAVDASGNPTDWEGVVNISFQMAA